MTQKLLNGDQRRRLRRNALVQQHLQEGFSISKTAKLTGLTYRAVKDLVDRGIV